MNIKLLKTRIVPNKRLLLGLFSLCLVTALLFSVFSSFLFIMNYMDDYIGEDTIYVFQEGAYSFRNSQLHLSTIDHFKNLEGVSIVSPESFVYSFVKDQPVIIRGITHNTFVLSEYFELKEGELITENDFDSALIGEDIAKKLDLNVNDTFIIPSARISTYGVFKVKGIFKTYSLMDSEILIPLESVWNLDINPKKDYFSVARLKVNNSLFKEDDLKKITASPVYDVSSVLLDKNTVQNSLTTPTEELSLVERVKRFLGYKPSAKEYIQEAVEEVGEAIDREDYVKEEIEKIKEDLPEEEIEDIPPPEKREEAPEEPNIEIKEENADAEELTDTSAKPEVKEEPNTTDLPPKQTTPEPVKDIPSVSVSLKDNSDVLTLLVTKGFKEAIYVFAVITVIVIITSIFAIFSSVANMIFESRKELAMISKVGGKHSQISTMFLFRLVIATLLASFLGILIGFSILLIMSKLSLIGLGSSIINPILNIHVIIITLAFTLITSMISAIVIFRRSRF